jgi:hypothetical protein
MLVVWEPVIWSDVSPPTSTVLGLIHDQRAVQYWDPDRVLSADIVRSVRADPAHYTLDFDVEQDMIVWDFVAVFESDAHWGDAFPPPVFNGFPVVQALRESGDFF